jgi:hypothetical protein
MRTVLAPRKADDVTLLQHTLTFGRAQRRLAAPMSSPPMRWPTNAPLTRQPSRSRVPSHSSLLRLKVFTVNASNLRRREVYVGLVAQSPRVTFPNAGAGQLCLSTRILLAVTGPLSDEEIAELEALSAAATPAPWPT